jgi:hypothetical protein
VINLGRHAVARTARRNAAHAGQAAASFVSGGIDQQRTVTSDVPIGGEGSLHQAWLSIWWMSTFFEQPNLRVARR